MGKNDIYLEIKNILQVTFAIPEEQISLEKNFLDDLDLDSIDAVDLIVKLKEYTSVDIPPEIFEKVRTVSDVVDMIYSLLEEKQSDQA